MATAEKVYAGTALIAELGSKTTSSALLAAAAAPTVTIYTDGSCQRAALTAFHEAGYGIFYAVDDPRNTSTRVPSDLRQTNNMAELLAIIVALRQNAANNVVIYTDSQVCINNAQSLSKHSGRRDLGLQFCCAQGRPRWRAAALAHGAAVPFFLPACACFSPALRHEASPHGCCRPHLVSGPICVPVCCHGFGHAGRAFIGHAAIAGLCHHSFVGCVYG